MPFTHFQVINQLTLKRFCTSYFLIKNHAKRTCWHNIKNDLDQGLKPKTSVRLFILANGTIHRIFRNFLDLKVYACH